MIELMVVITIIAILASLLMPAISSVRSAAKKVDCMNRHRQTGTAIILYTKDNSGKFPTWQVGPNMWYTLIDGWPRLGNDVYDANRIQKYFCSEDRNWPDRYADFIYIHNSHFFSIGYNDPILDHNSVQKIMDPTSTIMLGDTLWKFSPKMYGFARVWYNVSHESVLYPRHSRGRMTNITMVDGRVTPVNASKPYDYESLYRSVSEGGVGILGSGPSWWGNN